MDNIIKVTKSMKNKDLIDFYAFCANNENKENTGFNAWFSNALIKNIAALATPYFNVLSTLYQPTNNVELNEYNEKTKETVLRFADRDNQGNIKFDEAGNPVVSELYVECQEELENLKQKYSEVLKKHQDGIDSNVTRLEEMSPAIVMYAVNPDFIPNNITPRQMSFFCPIASPEKLLG